MKETIVPWLQEMLDKAEKDRLARLAQWRREDEERERHLKERLHEMHKRVQGNDYY